MHAYIAHKHIHTYILSVRELKDADEAVRMGGKKGVGVGADDLSPEHNRIMYQVIVIVLAPICMAL